MFAYISMANNILVKLHYYKCIDFSSKLLHSRLIGLFIIHKHTVHEDEVGDSIMIRFPLVIADFERDMPL